MLPTLKVRASSTVYIKAPFWADIISPAVYFAFVPVGDTTETWVAGEIDGTDARILIGPDETIELTAGVLYTVLGKVVDTPEEPVEELGYIRAT